MSITDPALAARIAATGVPLSADWAPQPATPRWHQLRTELIRTFSDYMPETARTKAVDLVDEVITEALLEGTAEIRRLKDELERRTEDLAFLERSTLPELRRTIQRHEDGKKRWRDRAEKAEAERARFKAAWQSARFRAQAYSEGILRHVADREPYQVWLRQAEAKFRKIQYGCETPESHLYGCPCGQTGGAS
jgi:hypothetical protein